MNTQESVWTVAYMAILVFVIIATGMTLLFSFRTTQIKDSAAQYITCALVQMYLLFAVARLAFYVGVLVDLGGIGEVMEDSDHGQFIGVRVIYYYGTSTKPIMVIFALIGDFALLSTTLWVITIAYELKRLITLSMDRGKEKERVNIRRYCVRTYLSTLIILFALVGAALAAPDDGYTVRTVAFILQTIFVWISLLYASYCTILISLRKRLDMVVDPSSLLLHRRMKNLVRVYCVLVIPSGIVNVVLQASDSNFPTWVGISLCMFYLSGGASALVIGASLPCCFRALRPIMPPYVYEDLLENGYLPEAQVLETALVVDPPLEKPVFVYTDIEGSTALWSNAPQAMAEAQSVHDDLLRTELLHFYGYEITTVGDAFQLAFYTVSDAIGWCLSVQQKLLKADWPEGLLDEESARRVTDMWGQPIFSGLRVRMAIHDGDENLVCSKHPTTGKMTYLGVSELVAGELGDMGHGGQIIISETALAQYKIEEREQVAHPDVPGTFSTKPFEKYEREDMGVSLQLHDIICARLGDRFKKAQEVVRSSDLTHRIMMMHQS